MKSLEFDLDRVPHIVQAPNAIKRLGTIAKALNGKTNHVLLIADPALEKLGHIDAVEKSLRDSQLEVTTYSRIESDPKIDTVDAAVEIARSVQASVVIAMGGGSVLDVGKTVAAVVPGDKPTVHYALCANPLPANPLPTICVPSTSGTGSETTRTTVLSDKNGNKLWFWGSELKPTEVVLDPQIVTGLPAHLTAATGIDAFVHALEACTNSRAYAANNIFAHEAIRLVNQYLITAVKEPDNLEARAGLQFAAALAGIAIDNAGTAIAHNIGHAIASLRPIHHGRSVGLAVLATLAWNIEDDDGRFADVAKAMGLSEGVKGLPAAFEKLLRNSGVKVSLAGEGFDDITPEQLFKQMSQPENLPMLRANKREVKEADMLAFAKKFLTQV